MPRQSWIPTSLCVVCLSFLQHAAGAEEAASAKSAVHNVAKAVAPFVKDDTLLVAHIDLVSIDVAKLYSLAESFLATGHPLLETQTTARRWLEAFRQAGGRELYVIVSLADLPDGRPSVIVPLGKQADEKALQTLAAGFESVERVGDTLFIGTTAARKRLAENIPAQRPELARALSAVGERQIRLILMPSAESRRVVEELLPTLPPELGGGPTTTLSRGALWAAIGGDVSPKPALRLVAQSQTANAAREFTDYTSRLVRDRWPQFDKFKGMLLPTVQDDRVTLSLDDRQIVSLAGALRPAIERLVQSQRRRRSTTSLMQIALAMHTYADAHKHFPPAAIDDSQERPLLSWRVAILPYLDQGSLYKEFHLDEPWDSAHNAKLIERMPAVYRSLGSAAAASRTSYVVPVGPRSAFEPKSDIGIGEITDGTSNTIMVIEVADQDAVIWTKPDDYDFDPEQPLGPSTPYDNGRLIAFCDGSAHFLPKSLDDDTLRELITRNGGEVVTLP